MSGRVIAVLASCAIAIAACASAQSTPAASPSSGQATPTVAPTASPRPTSTPVAGATQHMVADVLELDAPASWHVERGGLFPSGNGDFDFFGPSALPGQCEAIGQGTTECHPWPIMRLEPGSIVVAVRTYGMPGSKPPTGGKRITVSGQLARWIVGPASETCREIGGSVSDTIVIPQDPRGSSWLSLDGCIAGPDTAKAESTFSGLVRSLSVVR
jgi:hypothetical protein